MSNIQAHLHTPIEASLTVLETITPEQRERLTHLIQSYDNCNFVTLQPDAWMKDALLFTLWTRKPGPLPGDDILILDGLIESDGSSHT